MTASFVHLHNHTEYSLLDGAVRVKDLINQAKEFEMPAVAMTDHGVLYGMINFYHQAVKAGIKPLIGCEVYLVPTSRFENNSRERYHLVLLAVDKQGYHNLIKIVSKSWLEGFYYKPRVDKDLLFEYNKGLVALSACVQGEIPQLILNDQLEKAEKTARDYQAIFGKGNFFFELQDHHLPQEKLVNNQLIQLANKLNLPMVVTNDVHYLQKEDATFHDVLLCLQTGKRIDDEKRLSFPNDQFYFKSPEEMFQLFPRLEDSYLNTVRIAERSELKLDFNSFYLPDYPNREAGMSPTDLLRKKCEEGLKEKDLAGDKKARDRLKYELGIIEKMGYVSYFLIVWDFIDYARKNGIRVGPGRGSAAGSLVSYLLGITKINPLKYNLIFERFLNPERVTMPDIDVDFDEQRDKIIEYVKKRYGREKVAQIGTFGTMAARAAIRDVGRVLDLPLKKVDKIAKMVPEKHGITLEDALKMNKDLLKYYQGDEEVRKLLDYARGIEGMPRHISTHAAGVIIGADDLSEIIPLQLQDGAVITQLPMNDLEDLGLLKMDFLGLRNLTVINKSLGLIKERFGEKLDIDKIPLDDPGVYQLLQQGKTQGVFQMESYLFQDLNQRLKPARFSDLIALLALGRPGPLGSNLVDQFIESRHGKREAEYLHPALKPILEETFGLILYQEQVMEITSKLAGYTMGEADLLRRGMSKKKKELIINERERFIKGAVSRGIEASIAHQIFDQMEYFSGYGFNKSHSTAYAFLAYQTAYLKVNYPAEFMAGLLSTVMNNLDKVGHYIKECNEMGIEVLPPDVNESGYEFKTTIGGQIRFGLKAIKNVGENAIREIITGREDEPYSSLEDFIKRVDLSKVNIQVLESLIKAGAFDSFGLYRSQMLVKFEDIYEKIGIGRREYTPGQTSFFDLVPDKKIFYHNQVEYPKIDEFSFAEKLNQEKEYLGIYLSGHPLDLYKKKILHFTNSDSLQIKKMNNQKQEVILAGIVVGIKRHITKRNNSMAFLTLEDWLGKIEVVVFPKLYTRFENLLNYGEKILLCGRVDDESILADDILLLDIPFFEIELRFLSSEKLLNLKRACQANQGENPLFFKIHNDGHKDSLIMSSREYWVDNNQLLKDELISLMGKDNLNYY